MADYSNLSAADYLRLSSGDTAFNAAMEGEANKWRRLTGRSPNFSLGSSGTSSMLKSYMSQREDEILAAILEKQREAIRIGDIERAGGGIAGWSKWWKDQSLPAEYASRARAAFQSIQGETFQEAARGEAKLAAGYAKETAARADLKEKERVAVDAGVSQIFNQYSQQYRKAAQSAVDMDAGTPSYIPSWQTLEASIRDHVYGMDASESVKNEIFKETVTRLRDAHKPVGRFELEKRAEEKAQAARAAKNFPLDLLLKQANVREAEQKQAYSARLEDIREQQQLFSDSVVDQQSYIKNRGEYEDYLDALADDENPLALTPEQKKTALEAFEKSNEQHSKPLVTRSAERTNAEQAYTSAFEGMFGMKDPNAPTFEEFLQSNGIYETMSGSVVNGWQRSKQLIGEPSHYAVSKNIQDISNVWSQRRDNIPTGITRKAYFGELYSNIEAILMDKAEKAVISERELKELVEWLRSLMAGEDLIPPDSILSGL
jgi:hypothetical protein